MAGYIQVPRTGPVWEGEYKSAPHRPPIQFPTVRSGSRRDYSGHPSGTDEIESLTKFGAGVGSLLRYEVHSLLWHGIRPRPESKEAAGQATKQQPSTQQAPVLPQPSAMPSLGPVHGPAMPWAEDLHPGARPDPSYYFSGKDPSRRRAGGNIRALGNAIDRGLSAPAVPSLFDPTG